MPDKQKFAWTKLLTATKYGVAYLDAKQGAETKFTYALRRVLPQIGKLESHVQTALTDIEINNCVTETRGGVEGVIVRDDRNALTFTATSLKLVNAQKRDHLESEIYEIEPYFTRGGLPNDLTVDQLMAFAGLVFPAESLETELARLEDAAAENITPAAEETEAAAASA